jgi:AhpD family alkylhydroperoxidase
MNDRFKMGQVQPEAYKALGALDSYVKTTKIDPLHRELIRIRASQINGCAYCVNAHTRDARKLGESEQRIYLISVWRESPQFTEAERVILEMTEEVTLIHQKGISEDVYTRALALLGEEQTAQVIMAIVTINAWNRIGVGLRMKPQ